MACCHPDPINLAAKKKAGLIWDAVLIYDMLLSVPKLIKMSYGWWDSILLMWHPSCAKFILMYRWRYFLSPSAHSPEIPCPMGAKPHGTMWFLLHMPLRCSKVTQQGFRGCSRRTWVIHGCCARFADPQGLSQTPYKISRGPTCTSVLMQQNSAQNTD